MIRLTRPELGGALDCIRSVLESGFLVQGRNVERLESSVAEYVGRTNGIALNSGTSAIQCVLMALGFGTGDEIVVPDFTFPATANAVVACGAVPVLADIDPATFNLTRETVEAKITARTRAVMPVDLFGLAAPLEEISEVCRRRGLVLIEDAACALGASRAAARCGSFGAASVISFHPRKVITTAEGGMVLTDDAGPAAKVRLLRNHGMDRREGKPEFVMPGFNMRMNEIQACLGLAQMQRIDEMIEARRRIACRYAEELGSIQEIVLPTEPAGNRHTYQSYVVTVDSALDRDLLIAELKGAGIETAMGTYAVHAQPYYRDRFGYRTGEIAASYRAYRQSLSLPIYASMDDETPGLVAEGLKSCISRVRAGK
jgi:dTDP-4-amino-4,6-dideoxygalactose transaminase